MSKPYLGPFFDATYHKLLERIDESTTPVDDKDGSKEVGDSPQKCGQCILADVADVEYVPPEDINALFEDRTDTNNSDQGFDDEPLSLRYELANQPEMPLTNSAAVPQFNNDGSDSASVLKRGVSVEPDSNDHKSNAKIECADTRPGKRLKSKDRP
jgi:hypothetical protein